jgi:hypothetical protein
MNTIEFSDLKFTYTRIEKITNVWFVNGRTTVNFMYKLDDELPPFLFEVEFSDYRTLEYIRFIDYMVDSWSDKNAMVAGNDIPIDLRQKVTKVLQKHADLKNILCFKWTDEKRALKAQADEFMKTGWLQPDDEPKEDKVNPFVLKAIHKKRMDKRIEYLQGKMERQKQWRDENGITTSWKDKKKKGKWSGKKPLLP